MNQLYYVTIANDRLDWHTAFLITASTEAQARALALTDLVGEETDWHAVDSFFICATTDQVHTELGVKK